MIKNEESRPLLRFVVVDIVVSGVGGERRNLIEPH